MKTAFTAIRSEGGLLPADLLARIAAGDKSLPGTDEASYGLLAHETLGEAVNRAWSRLVGAWRAFRDASDKLPESDRGTTLTRERWLLPLFHELGFGRLAVAKAVEVDGRSFAVSHGYAASPLHLVSFRFELDKRLPGVSGAAASSPHGLLQDLLNRSDDHLWGFVANGRALRVLRDHHSLTRKAFVEFDLEQIFDGELYSEFRLLWLICHASRVQGTKPEDCVLEKWFEAVKNAGVEALDKLRGGVEKALADLATGLLRHPANRALRDDLASGDLTTQELYRQLMRLAYRLIFLFVAEDRGVLLDPSASVEARARFNDYYGTRRLRHLAERKRGGPHGDLWVQLRTLMGLLYEGYPALALPAFGSFLWSPGACPALVACELANEHLLAALRSLGTIEEEGLRRPVAWNLVAADELGGIYESLMELHPVVNRESDRQTFKLETAPGHERKTTGSYYTPSSLVDCLLDSALEPVLDEAARKPDAEKALLDLKVVDPACGSGHFLVAAARRISERLARVRTGDAEPAPPDYQHALRDVVGRCIYGVDLNDMAVELCKVALWMEAIEPGKPLSFLDAHIQQGNALLGATPKLLADGIPNDAWKPITGDDREVAKALKALNRKERKGKGQGTLWTSYAAEPAAVYDIVSGQVRRVEEAPDDSLEAVRAKESAWRRLQSSPAIKDAQFLGDLWCSAFVWPKDEEHKASAPTHEVFKRVSKDLAACPADTRREVRQLARDYCFFHWHAAFPAVFSPKRGAGSASAGWAGGFDLVLGNPPWDRIKLQEKEFFAARAPQVANAPNAAARKATILGLRAADSRLWDDWQAALRRAEGCALLARDSGRYPLCGRGDVNTYSLFAELNRNLLHAQGWAGFIVPTGIATDATTQYYFRALMETNQVRSLYDFQTSAELFGNLAHGAFRFCLLTLGKRASEPADFVFFAKAVRDLADSSRHYSLSAEDLRRLNPNTRTCPVFACRRDADITKEVYSDVSVLWREDDSGGNPWGLSFRTMFHMAGDSHQFHRSSDLAGRGWALDGNQFVREGERMLPLYEAKMFDHFDHRYASLVGTAPSGPRRSRKLVGWYSVVYSSAEEAALPRYWVEASEVDARLESYSTRKWLLSWRDICRNTDQRTVIASFLPMAGVGHTAPLCFSDRDPVLLIGLVVNLSSFCFDFIARQKLGGTHLTYTYLRQMPVLKPEDLQAPTPWSPNVRLTEWLRPRALELIYTSWDLQALAEDTQYSGPPFLWDDGRRFHIRAELDAAFFHLYGIARDDVDYIMESFWIVRNKDEKAHGSYRTKEAILDRYHAMQRAIDTGVPYQTVLDPPPAHPSVAHDESTRPEWAI